MLAWIVRKRRENQEAEGQSAKRNGKMEKGKMECVRTDA